MSHLECSKLPLTGDYFGTIQFVKQMPVSYRYKTFHSQIQGSIVLSPISRPINFLLFLDFLITYSSNSKKCSKLLQLTVWNELFLALDRSLLYCHSNRIFSDSRCFIISQKIICSIILQHKHVTILVPDNRMIPIIDTLPILQWKHQYYIKRWIHKQNKNSQAVIMLK